MLIFTFYIFYSIVSVSVPSEMNALVSKKMMKRIKKYIKTFFKVELSSSEEEEELSINENDSINENEDILTDENNLIENQQKKEANNDGDSDFHTVLLILIIYKLPGMFLLPEGYQDLAFKKKSFIRCILQYYQL